MDQNDALRAGTIERDVRKNAVPLNDAARAKVAKLKAVPPSPLDSAWVKLTDASHLLCETPPQQNWLLTHFEECRSVGVLPRGKAGTLTSAGGVGKTYAMIQLAIAVASGGFWFDFQATQGHVLLALAEEDLPEMHRRIWRACNALELSLDERKALAERIDILPLAGVPVALTEAAGGTKIETTPLYRDLQKRLNDRGVDWALVVLDPLSRWAGGGVEANNEFATRFVQAIEALTNAPGNPTVLVVHHSSKASVRDGKNDARGVTGLTDGFRWRATLDAVKAEDGSRAVKLSNPKNNYAPQFDDVTLVRNTVPGAEGTLRVASEDEAVAFTPNREDRAEKRDRANVERSITDARVIISILTATPGIGARELKAALRSQLGCGTARADAAIARLGEAIVKGAGPRGATPLSLDARRLPAEFTQGGLNAG